MNTESNFSQMRRGVLEMCILAIIRRRGEAYASDILDELKLANLLVVEGTLYPLLSRLKNEDMLTYRWEESRSGPPRKYYQITEAGISALGELKTSWQLLSASVASVLNNNENESNPQSHE
ncbi:MAG TPA: PadR family transcriptional regulator [Bacteroidales bacterium]|nr:PadR family transcriptional regulator [Bacteroidales bacterium]